MVFQYSVFDIQYSNFMDWTTVVGILSGVAVVIYGLIETQSMKAFLNLHGFILVVGGTVAATLINTPATLLWDALKSVRFLFFRPRVLDPRESIRIVTEMAEKARRQGNLSIENDGEGIGDGFLQAAIDACLSTSDEKLAREVLNQRLRQEKLRHTEVANVFRTMSILFPMFGLIGTLIGIVTVLKNISNPQSVGPAMAVALSTAFFGILFANLMCVPIAGKLRLRTIEESSGKEMIAEGVIKIFFTGQLPSQIGLFLESYLREKLAKQQEAVSAAGASPTPGAETSTPAA